MLRIKGFYLSLLVHFGSTSEYWMKCFRLLTSGYSCVSVKEEISLLKFHSKLSTNSINNFYFLPYLTKTAESPGYGGGDHRAGGNRARVASGHGGG